MAIVALSQSTYTPNTGKELEFKRSSSHGSRKLMLGVGPLMHIRLEDVPGNMLSALKH